MNMYKSIKELTEKKSRPQTYKISDKIITEIAYQSDVLGITKTALINHYLENGIAMTKKDKKFEELENELQIKNEKSFEKYQSLENPEIQIKKNAKQKQKIISRTTTGTK